MRTGRRAAVAALIAFCGIAIAFGSVQTWIVARGRRPSSGISHTAIAGLLHWTYHDARSFTGSFAMVVVVAGGLVFAGGMFASRQMASWFSFIALAASALWIGLYATHYRPTDLPYTDLRIGAWLAIGGSLIGLMSSFFVRRQQI
jgi:drug/metabolite transporter (DMT)-like permease